MSTIKIGDRVSITDNDAANDFLATAVNSFANRVGTVEAEKRPGIFLIYFPPVEGGTRGARVILPGDLLAAESRPLTLEERVEALELALYSLQANRELA